MNNNLTGLFAIHFVSNWAVLKLKIMPTTVVLHQLDELAHGESKNEILLDTKLNTELHIIAKSDRTIIRLPYGNKFNVVDGMIIIYEK